MHIEMRLLMKAQGSVGHLLGGYGVKPFLVKKNKIQYRIFKLFTANITFFYISTMICGFFIEI